MRDKQTSDGLEHVMESWNKSSKIHYGSHNSYDYEKLRPYEIGLHTELNTYFFALEIC